MLPVMTVYRIPLDGDAYALIDYADEELVRGFNWKLLGNGYVMAQRHNFAIYLHRLIAGAGPDELVDHANRDPLDNRTANLRIATHGQNSANRGADRRRAGTTSRHKGVSWRKHRNCWGAYIHVNGKTKYLGSFKGEDEAARAYNAAALLAWGKFARLNDVPEATGGGDAK
jgi:type II secretory pathway component PulL